MKSADGERGAAGGEDPASAGRAERARPGLLDGIRVVEFAAIIAGPSCARMLADHGAEVIKIERYPDGDVARVFPSEGLARSAMFVQHNSGKQSLCVDLTRPEGAAIARDIVATADVVIEAFTPGVMRKLGLDYESLAGVNPRLVMCSISGFGQTGPNAGRPGYAHIAHSMAGWLALQFLHHDPPETPRGPGIAVADVVTGITAFGAICAALYRRERTGEGEYIDLALFDSLFCANDMSLQRCLIDGRIEVAYHPVHATLDGYVTANLGPDFRAWQNICKSIGRPELLADPRFATLTALNRHRDEATAIFREWLAGQRSEDAERVLTANHVVCARVLTVDEAVRQPQVRARGLVDPVDDPVLGRIEVLGSPATLRHASAGVRGPAPLLGEHNASILARILGYDEARIAGLHEAGVLVQRAV